MKSKGYTTVATVVVLSLLVVGLVPVAAQSSQTVSGNQVTTLIQLAQAAQSYAQKLLTIGQQQGVNVTGPQALITQGGALLSQAQNEASTNSTQAAHDAISSMRNFHSAAAQLQSEVVTSISLADEEAYLQKAIQVGENKTSQLQTIVNKACSSANASASLCSDANANLARASADLTNAAPSLLASITGSSAQGTISSIEGLLKDAMGHLQKVLSDISNFAASDRAQKALEYIQRYFEPRIAALQMEAQKANLTASELQQVQSLLSQAQSSLNGAVQSFQSGNFSAGVQQVKNAAQYMTMAAQDIQNQLNANYVQDKIIPQIAVLQQMAQKANLSSSVAQEVQSQLSQAQTLLNGAVQAFQSGNTSSGISQVKQAMHLMQQALKEIQGH